ncbi:MAG: ATP-binding protein [Lachnospiraceae bacterium]|nr:ATP-binding protein [Lachnospiraceae bacterium]
MAKYFNVNGLCRPEKHYMVDLSSRLEQIKKMVDNGDYFTINRGRQYGKTTTLNALAEYLRSDYEVVSLDFQTMSTMSFEDEQAFVAAFSEELLDSVAAFPEGIEEQFLEFVEGTARINSLNSLFRVIKSWCGKMDRGVVLIIDEVDTATNNQVFLDFLAQLRAYYLKRPKAATFQSVILAGVYDIRNIRRKIRPEEEHKTNSPWNTRVSNEENGSLLTFDDCTRDQMAFTPFDIAADFNVEMNFSASDIAGILREYEADYHTGMDIGDMSNRIYDYTTGYPYLATRLCKFMDEKIPGSEEFPAKADAWTKDGLVEAVKLLVNETNALFLSLKGKLEDYPKLRIVLYDLLFTGKPIPYTAMNDYIEIAAMFGFIRNEKGTAVIHNRIFETVLYNWFMSDEYMDSKLYDAGLQGKSQFITGGHLNVRRILERFVESFDDLYGDQDEAFLEEAGRRYFMLFLKPIINGEGNSYVEARTRNRERTDLVIDYHGEQFVIECKIWRGNAYHERGEQQLTDYLDYYHLKKGYMLSFNFNKKKQIGVREITLGDKVLVEAVV